MPPVRVWLNIGSNLDRERSLRGAVGALRERFGALILSRVYESEAVGFEGQPFYNLAAGLHTKESVANLRHGIRRIEDAFGRVRSKNKFAPRTLDIDLLTYGDLVGTLDGCTFPRDEILRYAFTLGPLAEVAGDELHPGTGLTYRQHWEAFGEYADSIRAVDFDPES